MNWRDKNRDYKTCHVADTGSQSVIQCWRWKSRTGTARPRPSPRRRRKCRTGTGVELINNNIHNYSVVTILTPFFDTIFTNFHFWHSFAVAYVAVAVIYAIVYATLRSLCKHAKSGDETFDETCRPYGCRHTFKQRNVWTVAKPWPLSFSLSPNVAIWRPFIIYNNNNLFIYRGASSSSAMGASSQK